MRNSLENTATVCEDRMSEEKISEEEFKNQNEVPAGDAEIEGASSKASAEGVAEKMPSEKMSPRLLALIQEIEVLPNAEAKLERLLSYMEGALSGSSSNFKSFWEARGLCAPLFKEHMSSSQRTLFWEKYTALSLEARRLKELFNEQSAFTEEQIEIAVVALEKDIEKMGQSETPVTPDDLVSNCRTLNSKLDFYAETQQKLDILNAAASRTQALRKELIKTEMRLRKKNKFFQRLSVLGDTIFPQRKELAQAISRAFIEDVESFVDSQLKERSGSSAPSFALREEIKALQGAAKRLTLSPQAFNQTRARLSECWDQLKELDKKRKQENSEKKLRFQENLQLVQIKIAEVQSEIEANKIGPAEGLKRLQDIVGQTRRVELGREEVELFHQQIAAARKPLQEQIDTAANERQQQGQEKIRLKQQQFEECKQEIQTLFASVESLEVTELVDKRDQLLAKIHTSPFLKKEKDELEQQLKPMRDLIATKKEQGLLLLSEDDRQSLRQLRDLLTHRLQRRHEVKEQLEQLRRANVSSGFDFEQAMRYQEQVNEEKERLQNLDESIDEVEEQIASLEDKLGI